MNARPFADQVGCHIDGEATPRALQVFIAYGDPAAGVRAIHVLANLGKGLGDTIEFRPTPWSFELLVNSHWHETAESAAVQADILIIAASATATSMAVQQWIETVLLRKKGMDSAIVALFGSDELPAVFSSSSLNAIRSAAQRAGLAFFAPSAESAPGKPMAGLHHRENIPPSPNGYYSHHRPPHWGINE
jgi:hypothetical protein